MTPMVIHKRGGGALLKRSPVERIATTATAGTALLLPENLTRSPPAGVRSESADSVHIWMAAGQQPGTLNQNENTCIDHRRAHDSVLVFGGCRRNDG